MAREADDWRLTYQQEYLQGATLTWKPYRAASETWEHEHCVFCWAKFMDPAFSESHRTFVAEHPDVLTEGFTTTSDHEHGADHHWVCGPCFDDFVDLFEWRVASGGPPRAI